MKQWLLNHLRAFMNGLGQLSRSPWSSFLTFAVIGVALALPLALSVALSNIQVVSNHFQSTGQINLYLKKDLDKKALHNTLSLLNMDESIQHSHYISPKEGLTEFTQNAGFATGDLKLQNNPLPGVFVVTPVKNLSTLKVQQLVTRLGKLPSVAKAQLDIKWLKRLDAILALGHRITLLLMLLFGVAVLLVIANTVRLATQNHREEIIVIKLIGGTNNFIRRPFLYSGVLYGLIGAIVAWLLVDTILSFLHAPVAKLASLYGSTYHLTGLGLSATLYLLMTGALLGLLASWLAVTHYIRQVEP